HLQTYQLSRDTATDASAVPFRGTMKFSPIYLSIIVGLSCAGRTLGFVGTVPHLQPSRACGALSSTCRAQLYNWPSSAVARSKELGKTRKHGRNGLFMRGAEEVPIGARMLGTLPYLLPMLDGLDTGRYVFQAIPPLKSAFFTALAPGVALWDHLPYLPVVVFIGLSIVSRQQSISRFIRFNIQQAILVDIALILAGLLIALVKFVTPMGSIPVTNFFFYCLMGAIVYATIENLRGRVPNQV
ncbi:unnamed protein product, partial [Discosporangium mesarthrocarpum]